MEISVIPKTKSPEQTAFDRNKIVVLAIRQQYCQFMIHKKLVPITRIVHHFSFSQLKKSTLIGAFILILLKIKCPNGDNYYELQIESMRKGKPLTVLSFFTKGYCFKDPIKGNPMFNGFFSDITQILSELRFEPEVFLTIARILVPSLYEVTMHLEQKSLIEDDDYLEKFQKFNPFSIPADLFSLPMTRPEKRVRSCVPRIEQFSREPAVEVVEEETNKKPIKKRRN